MRTPGMNPRTACAPCLLIHALDVTRAERIGTVPHPTVTLSCVARPMRNTSRLPFSSRSSSKPLDYSTASRVSAANSPPARRAGGVEHGSSARCSRTAIRLSRRPRAGWARCRFVAVGGLSPRWPLSTECGIRQLGHLRRVLTSPHMPGSSRRSVVRRSEVSGLPTRTPNSRASTCPLRDGMRVLRDHQGPGQYYVTEADGIIDASCRRGAAPALQTPVLLPRSGHSDGRGATEVLPS